MRPHAGQQQQPHHQQQYCAVDNCLKQQQQQHFLKGHQSLQQQQTATHLQQQQNYHQHQLQLNHVLQQQQPPLPPPHMWNPHLNAACYNSQPPTNNANGINSATNPNHINLQNCRPFPSNRVYQHHTHTPLYPPSNGFPHGLPTNTQASERMPLTAPNYAKLPPLSVVNQQRINECAGIPLISTATAHLTPGQRQRLSRKQSHSPPGKNWANMLPGNTAQNYAAAAQYAAAHAQGAPLMLNKQQQQKPEYWSPSTYFSPNKQQLHQQQYAAKTMQYNNKPQDRTRTPLRYQNSAPAALSSSKSKENLQQQLKHSKDNENSSSNNGDSSNSNETCLPRIIKPRKRRKKDRKPPNNLVNAVYMKMDNKSCNSPSSTIKTCKSSEDLLKCLQKFTQITNLNEQPSPDPNYSAKTGLNHDTLSQSKKEPAQSLSLCSSGSDINHGICFCIECDPLRSIWDYPLRRSLSDSASSDTSGTGSLSDNATTSSNDSADTAETNWPKTRADIVGVIGSKRNKDQQNSSYTASSNKINNVDVMQDNKLFNNILSGINLASELFKHSNSTAGFGSLDTALRSGDNMLLLPETAENLLAKSINEISKKLIETCSNESCDLPLSSCNSLSSFSTTSSNSSSANSTCADFSNDSGIESAHINAGDDLVFNFDNLHITTTKLSLSPSSLSSASSTSSSSSSSSSSSTTSSCGNISMSSSPTVKFASNFLTTQTTASSPSATAASEQTPLTPSNAVMGTTIKAAPTLDLLVDLNNNHLHVAAPKAMIVTENKQLQQKHKLLKQQFNDLVQKHQPPHQQPTTPTPTTHQHDQQFFNNCFDLMWQQHERQLGNVTTTTSTASTTNNNTSNHIDQLTSSALPSNNVAMSSFLDSVGSLKAVFSTIS
ncbi:G-box-binding factor [Calliphora vicina]|uniref:G-box-binding factor n=1 Tax=Calliphora vicina TaxID=7373 RepID=UPI00325BD159